MSDRHTIVRVLNCRNYYWDDKNKAENCCACILYRRDVVVHVCGNSHEMSGARSMHADAIKMTPTEIVCVVTILMHWLK